MHNCVNDKTVNRKYCCWSQRPKLCYRLACEKHPPIGWNRLTRRPSPCPTVVSGLEFCTGVGVGTNLRLPAGFPRERGWNM